MTTTTKKKAREGDVVELLDDLPRQGLTRGQRGVVTTEFYEPSEAYDVAIEDEQGNFVGFAYSVKPEQITNVSLQLFEQGIAHLREGELIESEELFRRAIDMSHSLISVLHNSIILSFANSTDYGRLITALRLVYRLDPEYEIARNNLAIAYQKYGIQKAEEGDTELAKQLFHRAIAVAASNDTQEAIQRSYSVLFTQLGTRAFGAGDFQSAFFFMLEARMIAPSDSTRANLGRAYITTALSFLGKDKYEEAAEGFERGFEAGITGPELL